MHNTDHNKQKMRNDAHTKWEHKVIRRQNLMTYFDDEKEQASLIWEPNTGRQFLKGQNAKDSEKVADPWPLDPDISLPRNETNSWFLAWNEKHKY